MKLVTTCQKKQLGSSVAVISSKEKLEILNKTDAAFECHNLEIINLKLYQDSKFGRNFYNETK